MYIAYRVNITDKARSLLHERTQTGARSTAGVVALRASLVFGHLTYDARSSLEKFLRLHTCEVLVCITALFMTFV